MTETNELHFSNLNGNSLWQNKFYITLWAVQVDAQVDSDTAACLETALMSPGNQRSWTPSQLVRLHFNPNSPFKKKAFSGKEQRTTFLLSNAFHISNRNKLVRLVLLCWSVRRSRSSPRIQPDQLRADVCMSQRNRNSFAYLLERRWRSRAFKGTQRGTTKTSNGSGSHTWVGETKRGNDVLNEPQGQGHQTEALPHSKPVHGDTGPRKETQLQLKKPSQGVQGENAGGSLPPLSDFLPVPSTGQSQWEANWEILGNVAHRVQPLQHRQPRKKLSLYPRGRHLRASQPRTQVVNIPILNSEKSLPCHLFRCGARGPHREWNAAPPSVPVLDT